MSVNSIKSTLDYSEYSVRKAAQKLEELHLIHKIGNGTSTKYILEREGAEFITQLQVIMEGLKSLP